MEIKHSHLILDACCILNFCASGYLIEILKSIPVQVTVTEVVREKELITLMMVSRQLARSRFNAVGQLQPMTKKQFPSGSEKHHNYKSYQL